ncbi:MFS transporter [Pseudonocardia sp. NPDC046786]|uniref:MFS transporter n=1 Tax=Pseudonocardia sp. NPDC046786 TaxID=3155471 RepID=UPI0033E8C055
MTADELTAVPGHPRWREWVGLVLLALPLFMMATDFTVMFLVMPAVAADLGPSATQMLWIVHVGQFIAAGLVITMGRLTDKVGHRTLLLWAVVLYGAASALAAFSPNSETLVMARLLVGVATGAASPPTFAIVRSLFTGARHYGTAFAVIIGAFFVGKTLGPPLGGLLMEFFWWGSVFLVNVPVALLVLLGGVWLFPRGERNPNVRVDLVSVSLSIVAIVTIVFGLQEIAAQGLSAVYLLPVVIGLVLGALFLRRQNRIADPLLDLSLFRIRTLWVAAAVLFLSDLAFVPIDLTLVQFLQVVAGVPIGWLGLLLATPGIAALLGTSLTPVLSRRIQPSHLIFGGIMIAVLGATLVVVTLLIAPGLVASFVVATTLISLGVSPLMVLGSQMIVTAAPRDRAGSAVAIQDIGTGLGGATGMALVGSLSMAVFSRTLVSEAPAAVSDLDLDVATHSPGGGVAVAERIDGRVGQDLLTAVQHAWSMGTMAAAATAVIIGAVMAVLVLRGLRGVTLPTDSSGDMPGQATPAPEPASDATTMASPAPGPSPEVAHAHHNLSERGTS